MLRSVSTPGPVTGRRGLFDRVIERATGQRLARRRFAEPEAVCLDHLRREVGLTLEAASGIDDVLGQCEAWLECLASGHPDRVYQCLVKCAVAQQLQRVEPDAAWTDAQRARCTDLAAKTWLNPLDVDLVRRLPSGDVHAVLGVALQQAVDDPDWSDHLLPFADLFAKLQGEEKERPEDLGVAWALRGGLLQALDQRDVSPMRPVEVARRAWIEQRLGEGPIGQFGRARRAGDLSAAVACVRRLQALNEALALEMATDVVEAVTAVLARGGLKVKWATLVEDRMGDLPQRFVEVWRAWSILRSIDMAPSLALAVSCQRWLQDQLLTDGAKPMVLGLLSGDDPAHPPMLMDLFEHALCSNSTEAGYVELLILRYAEHIDLADVLAPIRAPVDPKTPPVSGFDRLCALGLKLADPSHRRRLGDARQDAWRPGWAVLLGLSGYLFDHKGEKYVHGDKEILFQPSHHLYRYLYRQMKKKPRAPGLGALMDKLWLCSAANGVCSPFDGQVLLRWGLESSPVENRELLPFWTSALWERLFARLAPHAVKGLSEPEQQALLRRNLMGILLCSTPHVMSTAVQLAGQRRFAEGPDWATASVDACLQWAGAVFQHLDNDHSKPHELARLWRHYAKRNPDWFGSTKAKHPWIAVAIGLLEEGKKRGERVGAAISSALREQLIKKS